MLIRFREVAFGIHARMQHTHNQDLLLIRGVENDVGLILVASDLRGELRGAASDPRIVGEYLKAIMQPEQVGTRLFKPEVQDRVFVDSVEIGDRFFWTDYRRPSALSRASTSSMMSVTDLSLTPLLSPSWMACFSA